jgi:glycine oxidase
MLSDYDYIIVGQGLAGTLLAHFLEERGSNFLLIDQGHAASSSKVAAGMINPITGRKYVKSWRIEEFLPFARKTYEDLGSKLGISTFSQKNILRVLFTPEDENTWLSRSADPLAAQYIIDPADASECEEYLNGAPAYGELTQSLIVNLSNILEHYRRRLLSKEQLLEDRFKYEELKILENGIQYSNLRAKAIIFAEGHQVKENPFFNHLPWQPVKGEVLIVRIPGAPFKKVIRHQFFITHLEDDLYWVGSAYIHQYEDSLPTEAERIRLEEALAKVLKLPFEVVEHKAGIRPAVRGRRPVMGPHPKYQNVLLFNGLGTKGSSLGPYFAHHFVQYLMQEEGLEDEVLRLF